MPLGDRGGGPIGADAHGGTETDHRPAHQDVGQRLGELVANGEDDFGRYSAALAFVGIFTVFADLGIASYAVREIARARDRAPSLLVNMAVIRIGLSIVVVTCTVSGAWLAGYDRSMISLIAMAGVGLLLYSVLGAIEAVLQGFERYDTTSLGSVINQVVYIAVAVPLLVEAVNHHPIESANATHMIGRDGIELDDCLSQIELRDRPLQQPVQLGHGELASLRRRL